MKTLEVTERLNHIPYVNDFLDARNRELEIGDRAVFHAYTSTQEHERMRRKYPFLIRDVIIATTYLWHSWGPKVRYLRPIYFKLAGEKHRSYSRTEILGRVCRAGFRILEEVERDEELYILAEKKMDPLPRNETCVSPILRLDRVGKGGKLINVYKFRTMHSYAQYLQEYVYEHNHLREGGKLKDDFRISIWGRILRPLWLDELPMLWNLLRGDVKLVGVRPLSEQYFSLYSPEMQQLHIKVKPGLIPPFYYEHKTPKGLEEVQASERRYIEAYLRHPRRTDWKYFWGILGNIFLRLRHSH